MYIKKNGYFTLPLKAQKKKLALIKILFFRNFTYTKIADKVKLDILQTRYLGRKFLKLKSRYFLNEDEENKAKSFLKQGKTYSEIAKKLNRRKETILWANSRRWRIPYQWSNHNYRKSAFLPEPNKEAKQILFGGLIGDGSLSQIKSSGRNSSYSVLHSEKQKEYCLFKMKKFGILITKSQPEYRKNDGWGKKIIRFRTLAHPFFTELRKELYRPKKELTKSFLNKIHPLGITIWYLDDGCLSFTKKTIVFHTEGFNRFSVILLQKMLKKFRIFSKIRRTKKGYIITLNRLNTNNFLDLIKRYVPRSMKYKTLTRPLSMKIKCFICKKQLHIKYQHYRNLKSQSKKFLCSEKCREKRRIDLYHQNYKPHRKYLKKS